MRVRCGAMCLERLAISCTARGGSPTVREGVDPRPPSRSGYRHAPYTPHIKLKTDLIALLSALADQESNQERGASKQLAPGAPYTHLQTDLGLLPRAKIRRWTGGPPTGRYRRIAQLPLKASVGKRRRLLLITVATIGRGDFLIPRQYRPNCLRFDPRSSFTSPPISHPSS